MREKPKWTTNEYGDIKPVCPYCDKPYGDGDIFDVKNYPDDGGAIMFLICQYCKDNKTEEEAELIFDWNVIRPKEKEE
jgi:hypothetical protein